MTYWSTIFMKTISYEKCRDKVFISLHGDLNLDNLDVIKNTFEKLYDTPLTMIAINCEDLHNLDSTVIACLLHYVNKAKKAKITIVFFDMNPDVKMIFQWMGLVKSMTIISKQDFEEIFMDSPIFHKR
jgi:anti-anti-sigma factor